MTRGRRLREVTSIALLPVAALGRAPRPLTGSTGARFADTHGIPLRQLPRDARLPRLGDRRLQPQPALPTLHHEQLAGRPAAGRTLDQQVASGFTAATSHERGRRHRESTWCCTGSTETVAQVWFGLNRRLRGPVTTTSTIRSRARFLLAVGPSSTTHADAMDGNIRDTPPVVSCRSARTGPPTTPWRADRRRPVNGSTSQEEAAKDHEALGEVGHARAGERWCHRQARPACALARARTRRSTSPWTASRASRVWTLAYTWVDGKLAPKASPWPRASRSRCPTPGLRRTGLSPSACGSRPRAAVRRGRSSPMEAGPGYPLDLWVENDRVGMHVINRLARPTPQGSDARSAGAADVDPCARHLRRLRQRRPASRSTSTAPFGPRGVCRQADRRHAHQGALKIGDRHAGDRIKARSPCRMCALRAHAVWPGGPPARRGPGTPPRCWRGRRTKRSAPGEGLYLDWWLEAFDAPSPPSATSWPGYSNRKWSSARAAPGPRHE